MWYEPRKSSSAQKHSLSRVVLPPKDRVRRHHFVPPVFPRLGFDAPTWCELVQDFGRMFRTVARRPQAFNATRSRVNQHRFHLGGQARKLLTATD
jgi:hypothetical protein